MSPAVLVALSISPSRSSPHRLPVSAGRSKSGGLDRLSRLRPGKPQVTESDMALLSGSATSRESGVRAGAAAFGAPGVVGEAHRSPPLRSRFATLGRMTVTIPQRELRNQISDVLRRAEQGERFTITVGGRPVAELGPLQAARRPAAPERLAAVLADASPDAGWAADLARMRGEDEAAAADRWSA